MNASKMFISFVPWLLFSVMIHRHGANAAGVAALLAAGLALLFAVKGSHDGAVKVIDVTGIATFAVLAAACFTGGDQVNDWAADYGRGACALVLAVVMLGSCLVVPFTEQYAREVTPPEVWGTRGFRVVNRRISAVWGAIVLVMAFGHLFAGIADPATAPAAGSRTVDLVLNWVLPIALVLAGVRYTTKVSDAASDYAAPREGRLRAGDEQPTTWPR